MTQHERSPEYREGEEARISGKAASGNPFSPDQAADERQLWNAGWLHENAEFAKLDARVAWVKQAEEDIRSAIAEHRSRHAGIADKLDALGIDPYELRAYLAGLLVA